MIIKVKGQKSNILSIKIRKMIDRKKLNEKYNIKEVQEGEFADGFYSCLDSIDRQIIINNEDRTKIEILSHKLVLWNAKKLNEKEFLQSALKILNKEFKHSWKIFCKSKLEWAKLVKFVRED